MAGGNRVFRSTYILGEKDFIQLAKNQSNERKWIRVGKFLEEVSKKIPTAGVQSSTLIDYEGVEVNAVWFAGNLSGKISTEASSVTHSGIAKWHLSNVDLHGVNLDLANTTTSLFTELVNATDGSVVIFKIYNREDPTQYIYLSTNTEVVKANPNSTPPLYYDIEFDGEVLTSSGINTNTVNNPTIEIVIGKMYDAVRNNTDTYTSVDKVKNVVSLTKAELNALSPNEDDNTLYITPIAECGDPISKHSELILDDGTNPHGTTKGDVGLGNVDNTSDLDKPPSNPQKAAFVEKIGDSMQGDLTMEDSSKITFNRTDGTIAGSIQSDDPDQFGFGISGIDGEGNLANIAVGGNNVYIGLNSQYIANNSVLPHGYLKLSGEPVLDNQGREFYPITFQQIEEELYSESFTDSNLYDISAGSQVSILTSTPLVNNYGSPADFQFSFRLQETSGRSTEVEYWFEVDGVPSEKSLTIVGADTIVTVNGAFPLEGNRFIGEVIELVVQAITIGQGRETLIRGDETDTSLTLRQIGFGANSAQGNNESTSTDATDNPFSYNINNGDINVKMRAEINSITTKGTMFTFDPNYNLVRDPLVVEDPFFIIDENDDIKLKDL